MKRLLMLLLCFVLCFALFSCGDESNQNNGNENSGGEGSGENGGENNGGGNEGESSGGESSDGNEGESTGGEGSNGNEGESTGGEGSDGNEGESTGGEGSDGNEGESTGGEGSDGNEGEDGNGDSGEEDTTHPDLTLCYRITFDAQGGSIIGGESVYYLEIGAPLTSIMQSLPDAEYEGYYLYGWYPEGNPGEGNFSAHHITTYVEITGDTTFYAKWQSLPTCDDGTYNHSFGEWRVLNMADCSDDGLLESRCSICDKPITKIHTYASGEHTYTDALTFVAVTEDGTKRIRVCSICDEPEVTLLENRTEIYLKNTPVINGEVYGASNVSCLYNNNWTETSGTAFTSKGSPVTLELSLKGQAYVDFLVFKGSGIAPYTAKVLYEGDSSYTTLGSSQFGDTLGVFIVNGIISKVQISHGTTDSGVNFWQELALLVLEGTEPYVPPVEEEEEPEPETVTVTFNFGDGVLESGNASYTLEKGKRLISVMELLPVAVREGYYFDGWYPEGETEGVADYTAPRLVISEKIEGDVVYHAKWFQLSLCDNGTYNHEFGVWNHTYQPATCTENGLSARECAVCGYMIVSTQTYATGHSYGDYLFSQEVGQLKKVRSCTTCGNDDEILFTNKTIEYMNGTPSLTGDIYGSLNFDYCLYNNNWTEKYTAFASKGGAVEVEFELKEGSYIDYIYFKGDGSVSYTVYVLYEGASDYTLAGMGSFGEIMGIFEVDGDRAVQAVKITHGSCGNGTECWQEVAFVVEPN